MQNRTPIPRDQRPPVPAFAPVPRQCNRHDGWTPERQRAFIEALADTGSVSTAARMVNTAAEGAYALRRHPDAAPFRRAWEAALDMGVQRLKDEAFERAINGQLVPVFVAGKLMGFRRKKNDRLLMYCLRHYGQDAQGRRVTINYFSNRATAGAALPLSPLGERQGEGLSGEPAQALAQATATTLTTTLTGPIGDRMAHEDAAAQAVAAFEGVALDPQAQSEILAVLEACAARTREIAPEDDPDCVFVPVERTNGFYAGELESGIESYDRQDFKPGEPDWTLLGDEPALAAIDAAVAAIQAEQALPEPERAAITEQRAIETGARLRRNNIKLLPEAATPLPLLPERARQEVMRGGPNFQQRDTARRATALCIEAARREWIAAETEEGWEAWKARGG